MNWRQKAFLYSLIGALPRGEGIAYGIQRYVTRSLPRKIKQGYQSNLRFHAENLKAHAQGELGNLHVYEFGVGWDLFYNVGLWCFGVQKQTVLDVRRNLRLSLVNLEIDRFRRLYSIEGTRKPRGPISNFSHLDGVFGIRYLAPADARRTPLGTGEVDAVISTNTLEHIPIGDLHAIFVEVRRVLASGGIASVKVDYSDHYGHSDPTIGPYNYMKFDGKQWSRWNPTLHFQNRARHGDYLQLFQDCGFDILLEETVEGPWEQHLPSAAELAPEFRARSDRDIRSTTGFFVLRKRS